MMIPDWLKDVIAVGIIAALFAFVLGYNKKPEPEPVNKRARFIKVVYEQNDIWCAKKQNRRYCE